MNRSTIPTILAILILVVCIASVTIIVKGVQVLKSNANGNLAPYDIRVTNVRDTSFTISFLTTDPSIGFIRYSANGGTTQSAPTNMTRTHLITVQNLKPGTDYSFEINSGGDFFGSVQNLKQVTTLTSYIPSEKIMSGKIVDENNLPIKDALVLVANEGVISWSTITSAGGSWVIALPTLPDSAILQILVQSLDKTANAMIDVASATSVPDITLGGSYDFRNQGIKQASDSPQVPIILPLTP